MQQTRSASICSAYLASQYYVALKKHPTAKPRFDNPVRLFPLTTWNRGLSSLRSRLCTLAFRMRIGSHERLRVWQPARVCLARRGRALTAQCTYRGWALPRRLCIITLGAPSTQRSCRVDTPLLRDAKAQRGFVVGLCTEPGLAPTALTCRLGLFPQQHALGRHGTPSLLPVDCLLETVLALR